MTVDGITVPMATLRAPFLCAVALLVSAVGCTENTPTTGGRAKPVSLRTLAKDLAAAVCNNIGSCCTAAGISLHPLDCLAAVENENQTAVDGRESARPFDADEATSCVDAVAAATRRCDLGKVNLGAMTCVNPHGKVGEACESTCFERGPGFACGAPQSPVLREGGAPAYLVSCFQNDFLYCNQYG